jgi:hypothetical protein
MSENTYRELRDTASAGNATDTGRLVKNTWLSSFFCPPHLEEGSR